MIKFGLFSVILDPFGTNLVQKVQIWTFSLNADHSGSTGKGRNRVTGRKKLGGRKKITAEIVATNVVASRPPNSVRLQHRLLVPILVK